MKSFAKKIFVVLFVLMAFSFSAYSQESSADQDIFYINVPILHVYEHIDAYMVTYAKGSIGTEKVFLAKEWFKTSEADKCRVRPLIKGMQPYMTIVYLNGSIQKVYLNMPTNHQEPCWKVLSRNVDVQSNLVGSPSELSFTF
ncbi:MAG: hypothetical protein K6G52_07360 [Treponemataceae bacterium]|nr:hypothetical protein [Treponemataceae bacterium]